MFNQIRFPFRIILLILLTLSISGCWDLVGVEERTIVLGTGIDKIPGAESILLTIQVLNPQSLKSGGGGGDGGRTIGASRTGSTAQGSATSGAFIVETSKGSSLYDAIYNFLKSSARRVTFSHNKIVVVGMDLAKSGIAGVFDDMERNRQFRPTNQVFVAEKNAAEILESRSDLGIVPALEVNRMTINLSRNPLILPVNRNEFLYRLKSEGHTSVAPLIAREKPDTNSSGGITIETNVVFKNNRLIDLLTIDESQGLLWFSGNQKGGLFLVPYPTGKDQKKISVEVRDGATRIKPRKTKDGIIMEITCTGKGVIRETEKLKNNPKTIARLERAAEELLKQRVELTIAKARQIKADFLGYGRIIHRQYPNVWRRVKHNWDQEFPRIESKVVFHINISSFGLIKDSVDTSGQE